MHITCMSDTHTHLQVLELRIHHLGHLGQDRGGGYLPQGWVGTDYSSEWEQQWWETCDLECSNGGFGSPETTCNSWVYLYYC